MRHPLALARSPLHTLKDVNNLDLALQQPLGRGPGVVVALALGDDLINREFNRLGCSEGNCLQRY